MSAEFILRAVSWIRDYDDRLVATAVVAAVLYVAARILVWATRRGIKDERRRYTVRKVIRYSSLVTFLVVALGIWAQRLQGLLLIMGATGAGLAIALAPVLVSMAGWALITWSRLYQVGDRVQIGTVIGDVVDIGLIRTTLLEIGNWVGADQLTGRTMVVANAAVFKDPVFNYTQGSPYIWDEFTIPVAYGPKWEQAQRVMLAAIADYSDEIGPAAQASMQDLPGASLVGVPETRPQVYITVTEHWVACTLRYVVHARSRRTVKHRLQTQVLKALAKEGIEIASPALTVVRYPAERTWRNDP
jgi:small-conductance mechanosensitive channel